MSNAIVDTYTSVYIPRRSIETALTLIINNILIYLDNLSSAFDTLDHNILSIGLNDIGIHV